MQTLFKVNLIGLHNVGKTSFVSTLITGQMDYDLTKTHPVTGHDYATMVLYHDESQVFFHIVESNDVKYDCDVYMIMFDVTDEASYHAACRLLEKIEGPKMLIGNKCDLSERRYPSVECKTYYVSAKEVKPYDCISQPFRDIIDTYVKQHETRLKRLEYLCEEIKKATEELGEEATKELRERFDVVSQQFVAM